MLYEFNFKSPLETQKFQALLESISFLENGEMILEAFYNDIVGKSYSFDSCTTSLLKVCKEYAQIQAKNYKLKQKVKSNYEEEYLLTKYCFLKTFDTLPQWFKELL